MCVYRVQKPEKRASDPLELKVQVFVELPDVGAGNQTQIKIAIIPKLTVLKAVSVSECLSSRNMGP